MNLPGKDQSLGCFLCGSSSLVTTDYLNLNSDSFKRNFGYFLPNFVGRLASKLSNQFSTTYYPVSVNKKYFHKKAVYCLDCMTGSCQPFFEKKVLANYYKEFYWSNRDTADGQHVALDQRPNDQQLSLSAERMAWIEQYLPTFESVIDFGAGDCAAAFSFSSLGKAGLVHVVDPSERAGSLAARYRVGYSEDMAQAPIVDLLYSAHSIEHVHDLRLVIRDLLAKVRRGGHLFFETPNIGDLELFKTLPHTPHTFMLSHGSFRFLEKIFPVKVVAIEACGPRWRQGRKQIRSDEKADLRVLMLKTGDV